MSIKERIQNWLGITNLQRDVSGIANTQYNHTIYLQATLKDIRIIASGVSRIVVKFDPNYARHEDDKYSDSDKIGEEVLKRLKGEQKARNKYK